MKITADEIASFSDKDSKKARFRELYESNDFLTAYAKHTDLRVADDPHGSIGRSDQWESHGTLQLAFLVLQGLRPEHTLLDVGCGTGRGARKFVPYLNDGNYIGIDISSKALEYAMALAGREGWGRKSPTFMIGSDLGSSGQFDMIWAHSVFTHLPESQIEVMISNAAKIMRNKFVFTYKVADAPVRTGLKQYKYPFTFFAAIAKDCGLKAEDNSTRWPSKQRTVVLTRDYENYSSF